MSTSREILFDVAGEFYTEDPEELERIDRFIARAGAQLNPKSWGALYQEGAVYLAAHMLSLAADSLAGGARGVGSISAEKVGDLSRSYQYAGATKKDSDRSLSSTIYGAEFMRLRAMIPARTPLIVTGIQLD